MSVAMARLVVVSREAGRNEAASVRQVTLARGGSDWRAAEAAGCSAAVAAAVRAEVCWEVCAPADRAAC